jgi:hypothetical protein
MAVDCAPVDPARGRMMRETSPWLSSVLRGIFVGVMVDELSWL